MGKLQDRKQKARQERDELILDCATSILHSQGLHKLNMQAVAAMTDYSKGTIYQHYSCKEDLLTALVIRCGNRLLRLLQKAADYSGSLRCRVALISAAFFYNGTIEREVSGLVPVVKSEDFMQKVQPEHVKQLQNIDNEIFRLACMTFYGEQGKDGDLSTKNILDAAFGWWAMNWGLNDVINQGWDIERLGFKDPMSFYFRSLNIFLDGLGIAPDPTFKSWSDVDQLARTLFAEDIENTDNAPA